MRRIDQDLTKRTGAELDWSSAASTPVSHRAYHELSDTPLVELDALAQLEANVQVLEGLHGRLNFILREVRDLMKL